MKQIAIIGSGHLGQQILYHIHSDTAHKVVGFFDDFQEKGSTIKNIPILGNTNDVEDIFKQNIFDELIIASFINRYLKDFNNEIVNLAYPYQFTLYEILSHLEKYLGKKACYEIIEEGSFYRIEFNRYTEDFFSEIPPGEYLKKLCSSYL
ncbi:hypothetical protein [Chryseobacterium sp.]|uniref:nucleoside-diphosphate sugar epimerase/dehydratase n=1 Tax=Chryseobacterium sp. TaxID=1871047 RepID=UPI0028985EA0|nr:hypothetical protein [Chryseobacterium sp.]